MNITFHGKVELIISRSWPNATANFNKIQVTKGMKGIRTKQKQAFVKTKIKTYDVANFCH